jgi:hypothetical protein
MHLNFDTSLFGNAVMNRIDHATGAKASFSLQLRR